MQMENLSHFYLLKKKKIIKRKTCFNCILDILDNVTKPSSNTKHLYMVLFIENN